MFNNFSDTALSCCAGDVQKADYFVNCSYYEYYDRLARMQRYADRQKEAAKRK
jgi:hypothetical protein